MAAGVAFDPAEFAAYKSSLSGSGAGASREAAPVAPAADAFDPAEFQAFKASRSGGQRQPASFDERFSGAGTPDHPQRFSSEAASVTGDPLAPALRRTADEALIGKPSRLNDATAALFGAGQGASLNLAGNAAAGVATVLGNLDKIGLPNVPGYGDGTRSFSENYDRFRDVRDAYGRQSPKSSLAGTVAGAVAATPLMPGLPVAEGANLATRAGLYGLAGAGYGAAGEAIDSRDPTKAAIAGAGGFGAGAILGPVVEKLAPPVVAAAGKALEPVLARFGRGAVAAAEGFTPEARVALRAAGLDADNLPPELAQHVEAVFAAKGASVAAAREAQAAEFGLPLSRGQATGDPRALALEGRALAGQTGPRAQQIGEDFAARQADAVAAARDRFLGMAAGDAPRIERPQEAYEAVADRARQAAQAEAERASIAQRAQDDALRAVRGRGETDTLDGATAAAQGVRDAAEQGRSAYRSAYGEVGQIPGAFVPGAMDRVGARVRGRLGADVPIDDVLTPAASRAIGDLDNVPGLFGLQPGEGPDLRQIEQLRKRLVAYRSSTGQNPTDRRAVDRILAEFDGHIEDAMGAGLFGPRQAPRAAAEAADGFPGAAGLDAPSAPFPAAGGRPEPKSEPLTHYLARNGGIALDGDARAGDLGRVMTPYGPLGRKSGRPIEDFRDQLASEGFIRPDSADGMISRRIGDEVHDLIGIERGGNPVYRLSDISRGGTPADAGGRIAGQSATYAERLAPFRQQVADDLASVGVDPRRVDPAHLEDAAGRLFRREHDTGTDAYEAAVMAHPAGETPRNPVPSGEPVPFDAPTSVPTSDSLPIGDTGPAEAMRRARGLFRDYKQAFSPRGPGDTAGNNLRRIVERDASPNEVASMLFGSTTGRVSSGQIQTLTRLREAVGANSEPWQAVQRSLVARHLGGEGRDLGSRLDYLLRGEGRSLTPFLSQEQRTALGRLRAATTQAQNAGQAMPPWVSDLERTGFDTNAIGRSLFGSSGAIGARPGAALEAQAAKAFLGADSAEWSMLRQAAVQRLTDPAVNAGKTIERLRDFTDGAGKGVASALFGPEELGNLRRFAGALAATARPGTARGQEMSGPAAKALAKALDVIAGMVAFKAGGLPAAAGTYGAKVGQRAIMGGVGAAAARRSFEGGAPRLKLPLPGYATTAGSATGRVLAPLGQ